ncbi:Yip1 family protein [Pseudodonghicola flavimaris]|uniref:Yip1 family protein n=1 Tax=Pseudodonghicola flavimaris TaxID=3050036 RepID=A0ABT7F1K2_9RHOB|nr:Yip1 family protein [Pseudodonghicola flavimaris]MDK3018344.1 Yip1 family protein [Pseudodonghicola flavimaris]
MNKTFWADMIGLSLTRPAEAARLLIGLGLPRPVLWTALVLSAVLSALVYSLSDLIMGVQMPGPLGMPLIFAAFVGASLLLSVVSLYWAGRMLGGTASVEAIMTLVLWMQLLRILVQVATLVLTLLSPGLALIGVFAAMLFGLYIMVHFIDVAHGLASLPRAVGVLVLSMVIMTVILFILIALLGGVLPGTPQNV